MTTSKVGENRNNSILLFRKRWNELAPPLEDYEHIDQVNTMVDGRIFQHGQSNFLGDRHHTRIKWKLPVEYDCPDPRKCRSSYKFTTAGHGTFTIFQTGQVNRPGRKTSATSVRSFIRVTNWAKRKCGYRSAWHANVTIKNCVLSCRRKIRNRVTESCNTHESDLFPATAVKTGQCNPIVYETGAIIFPGGRTPAEFVQSIEKLHKSHLTKN